MPVHLKSLRSLALAFALTPIQGVLASDLYDSQGFESSAFSVGSLPGQGGWVSTAVDGGGSSNAVVFDNSSGDPIESGSQSVRLSRVGTDQGGSTQFSVPLNVDHGPTVLIQWEMNVPFSGDDFEYGPGFSLESYVDTPDGIKRVAGVGVDAADASFIEIFDNASADGVDFTDEELFLNTWQAWQVELDFASEKYFVSVDGITITPGGVEMLEIVDYAGGDRLVNASLVASATDAGFLGKEGVAFIDNFRIQGAASVPEPASTLMLGLGLAGFALRRRRRQ